MQSEHSKTHPQTKCVRFIYGPLHPLEVQRWLELVLGPSRSSAWLSFDSSFWAKKLCLARHAFHKAHLGSACHILQKSLVQLGLLYYLKNRVRYLKKKLN